MRLSEPERKRATELFKQLNVIKQELKTYDIANLRKAAITNLSAAGFKVDYVEIVNAVTLESIEKWDGKMQIVALIAAFLNEVRLIDNMILTT